MIFRIFIQRINNYVKNKSMIQMVEPKSTQHQFQRKQKGESYQRNSA